LIFDIVIEGGMVVDGTGEPGYEEDIGLKNGRIERLGDLSGLGRSRTIDAKGLVVSPGFIDVHSHSDFSLVMNPPAESQVAQGIVTEVIGNCGHSAFPLNEQSRGLLFDPEGVDNYWSTLNEYVHILQRQGTGTNVVPLVGHSTVRAAVVGKEDRAPSVVELKRMVGYVEEAMEGGCAGLSSGLAYEPGLFSSSEELVALCRVVARHGGFYTSHLRGYSSDLLPAVQEILTIGRKAGLPVHISHMHAHGRPNQGHAGEILSTLERARQEGLDVTLDVLSYPTVGVWSGLCAVLPEWAYRWEENGIERLEGLIRDPTSNDRMAQEIEERRSMDKKSIYDEYFKFSSWEDIVIDRLSKHSRHKEKLGETIGQVARTTNQDPVKLFFDLILDEGRGLTLIHLPTSPEEHLLFAMTPWTMFGTDSIATAPRLADAPFNVYPQAHPGHYGTFAHVLGEFVRERKLLSLPEAIRRCTSLPAQRFRLAGRGYVKEGFAADLVIFDQSTIGQRADFLNPRLYPRGIEYVVTGGQVALEERHLTKNLAGRVLLGGAK